MEAISFLARELKGVVLSVAPLVVILLVLKLAVFRSPLESNRQFVLGSAITVLGLFMFLQGAQMSVIPVAESTGAELFRLNRGFIILIAFAIGFVATLVEPALAAVAHEAEIISVGAITSKFIMGITALGFAFGMALGVTKIVYNVNFLHILVPVLVALAVLGYFCDQTFAAIAFDCAGATTGPVNIPINMAIALGLARSIDGVDPLTAGFGIVGLTVLGVAGSIMTVGIMKSM
ncbi:MAG: DUF1538 domain-containing protein [Planctomycetota bacterium]|jgi:hypothetical protein|nr:DUF1538 domain-containing protein [Planctomycetota bacterium]